MDMFVHDFCSFRLLAYKTLNKMVTVFISNCCIYLKSGYITDVCNRLWFNAAGDILEIRKVCIIDHVECMNWQFFTATSDILLHLNVKT